MTSRIGLADAINNLREELAEAVRCGDGQDVRFQVEGIDLELAVTCEVGGNGKVSFHVLGAGAEIGGKGGTKTSHRIKLALKMAEKPALLKTDGTKSASRTLVSAEVSARPK